MIERKQHETQKSFSSLVHQPLLSLSFPVLKMEIAIPVQPTWSTHCVLLLSLVSLKPYPRLAYWGKSGTQLLGLALGFSLSQPKSFFRREWSGPFETIETESLPLNPCVEGDLRACCYVIGHLIIIIPLPVEIRPHCCNG